MSARKRKTDENGIEKPVVFIRTFGCQMNAYDSQLAAGLLEREGFEVIKEEDSVERRAQSVQTDSTLDAPRSTPDIILMNTCSVRDHAEQRVFSRLGMLGLEKKNNPALIIGLMGCMVEEHGEKLFKRFPQLDLLVGTRNIKELPGLIREIMENRVKFPPLRKGAEVGLKKKISLSPSLQKRGTRISSIKQDGISIEYSEHTKRDSPYHAWLPIMTGCDKVCTFCIVPKTRGREVSMPAEEVCREAERLVANGVKWITLLGQNVNSYAGNPKPKTRNPKQIPNPNVSNLGNSEFEIVSKFDIRNSDLQDSGSPTFPSLLQMLCGIEGLEKISFMTSHPSDATEELFQVIAKNPKIGRRFHLPLQSGSDKILKRMKRLHVYPEFKSKIDRLRQLVPDIAITTDIIVGFPGETEEDYQATKRAMEEIGFDGAFIYKYSTRPGTPAAKLPDDVPDSVKNKRNNELLTVQRAVTEKKNRKWEGKIVSAFADGPHPEIPGEWYARTDQDKRIIFSSPDNLCGRFVALRITELRHETFRGELV